MEKKHAFLTIKDCAKAKAVPYGAGDRPGGSRNYGFRRLRGNPSLAESIPEAAGWQAISDALRSLNRWETPFFTIGCEKALNQDEGKYWARGYLEFAFNYVEAVSDAANYFPMFFHFSNLLNRTDRQLNCTFEFELEGAHFIDGPANGFSVAVWINTELAPNESAAKEAWSNALTFLVQYLDSVNSQLQVTPIYALNKPINA